MIHWISWEEGYCAHPLTNLHTSLCHTWRTWTLLQNRIKIVAMKRYSRSPQCFGKRCDECVIWRKMCQFLSHLCNNDSLYHNQLVAIMVAVPSQLLWTLEGNWVLRFLQCLHPSILVWSALQTGLGTWRHPPDPPAHWIQQQLLLNKCSNNSTSTLSTL